MSNMNFLRNLLQGKEDEETSIDTFHSLPVEQEDNLNQPIENVEASPDNLREIDNSDLIDNQSITSDTPFSECLQTLQEFEANEINSEDYHVDSLSTETVGVGLEESSTRSLPDGSENLGVETSSQSNEDLKQEEIDLSFSDNIPIPTLDPYPEDLNFNPFATKCLIRNSPPPSLEAPLVEEQKSDSDPPTIPKEIDLHVVSIETKAEESYTSSSLTLKTNDIKTADLSEESVSGSNSENISIDFGESNSNPLKLPSKLSKKFEERNKRRLEAKSQDSTDKEKEQIYENLPEPDNLNRPEESDLQSKVICDITPDLCTESEDIVKFDQPQSINCIESVDDIVGVEHKENLLKPDVAIENSQAEFTNLNVTEVDCGKDRLESSNITSPNGAILNSCPSLGCETLAGPVDLNSNIEAKNYDPIKSNQDLLTVSILDNFDQLGDEAFRLAEEFGCPQSLQSSLSLDSKECNNQNRYLSTEDTTVTEDPSSSKQEDQISAEMPKGKLNMFEENMSEAGPEIATGLTSSDLECASQFLRDSSKRAHRESGKTASLGSQSRDLSEENMTSFCESERTKRKSYNEVSPQFSPPRGERSAPEGTSSPDPRAMEDRSNRSCSEGRDTASITRDQVTDLLKKQEDMFERKLRIGQASTDADRETKRQLDVVKKEHQQTKEELEEVTIARESLLKLVDQYKEMLASLVNEKDKQCEGQSSKLKMLEIERNQALEDLSNVEAAFTDVHRKYERTKQVVETLRRNEDTLRNAVADYEAKLLKQEKKYLEFQIHSEEKLKEANIEYELLRKTTDQELTKMSALLKKAEMKIISLTEGLERKSRENQELTQLCDDLISKVGS